MVERRVFKGFCDRTASGTRRMMANPKRDDTTQRTPPEERKYRGTHRALPRRSSKAHERRSGRPAKGAVRYHYRPAMAEIARSIEHLCGLGARVSDQSRRRVLNGEQVPTAEKERSIRFVEPHDRTNQARQSADADRVRPQGLLAEKRARRDHQSYEFLAEFPSTRQHVVVSTGRNKQTSGVTKLYGSDSGFFSARRNVPSCSSKASKSCAFPSGAAAKAARARKRPMRRAGSQGRPALSRSIGGAISGLFRGPA